MSIKEYTEEELFELFNSKTVNGELSLSDLSIIAFDIRFPVELSQKTEEKLNELSKDYRKFSETKEKLAKKNCEHIFLLEKKSSLNYFRFHLDDIEIAFDEKTLKKIETINRKEANIIKEIYAIEDELKLDVLYTIFTNFL
jgi:hypothetical protein